MAQQMRYSCIDPERSCSVCRRQGLYRDNTSGVCQPCHKRLPFPLKSGPLKLVDVERQHAHRVLGHLTCRDDAMEQRQRVAAEKLGIDLDHLLYILELPAANDD